MWLVFASSSERYGKVFYTSYVHEAGSETSLSDNIVYSIVEDIHTRDLWIGTRSGLSIMHADRKDSFVNYKPRHSRNSIPCDEINSLLRDYAGNIWLASIGGGVMLADTRHLFLPDIRLIWKNRMYLHRLYGLYLPIPKIIYG